MRGLCDDDGRRARVNGGDRGVPHAEAEANYYAVLENIKMAGYEKSIEPPAASCNS